MLKPIRLFLLALGASLAAAQSLLTVLEENGFDLFAQRIQEYTDFVENPPLLLYATTNAALELAESGNGTVVRRETDKDREASRTRSQGSNLTRYKGVSRKANATSTSTGTSTSTSASSIPTVARLARQAEKLLVSVGEAFMNLLDDPEFVNLGPGNNQTNVEKYVVNSRLPVVFTGLGGSVKVTGDDIPFDQGVIRPVSGLFTLPDKISETLPFLGIDTFLGLLQSTDLIHQVDSLTAITLLAPDDKAFADISSALKGNNSSSDAELVQLLKQHVLLDFPAYTPLIEDGTIFQTLAGGTVTVTVRDGELYIEDAKILAGDAIVVNGVVHTIDKVLSKPPVTPPPIAAAAVTGKPDSWIVWVCGAAGALMAAGLIDMA